MKPAWRNIWRPLPRFAFGALLVGLKITVGGIPFYCLLSLPFLHQDVGGPRLVWLAGSVFLLLVIGPLRETGGNLRRAWRALEIQRLPPVARDRKMAFALSSMIGLFFVSLALTPIVGLIGLVLGRTWCETEPNLDPVEITLGLVAWAYLLRWVNWTTVWRPSRDEALRFLALIALALAVAVVGELALWAALPGEIAERLLGIANWTDHLFHPFNPERAFVTLAFPIWFWSAALLWLWLRRWRSTRLLAGTGALVAALVGYLAWDDWTVAPLPSIEQIAPLPPRGAESDAAFRSLEISDATADALRQFESARLAWNVEPRTEPERWRLFVVANRATIRSTWQAATGARHWLARLDEFPVIGEIWNYGDAPDGPVPWTDLREIFFLHCAQAALLASENRGDEALAILQPALSVSRKLQPAARRGIRLVLGRMGQEACQETARAILRFTGVPANSIERLRVDLRPAAGAGTTDARVLQSELPLTLLPALGDHHVRDSTLLGPFGRLFYLPRATANLAMASRARWAAAIAEGRGEEFRGLQSAWFFSTSFRNAAGQLVLSNTGRAFAEMTRWGWQIDDQRRALLADVQAKIAATEKMAEQGAAAAVPKGRP